MNVARCTFCGDPTDSDSPVHKTCEERHDKAVAAIPGLFRRIQDSGISAQRFCDLLRDAANASFVGPTELKELCREGVSALVSDILEHRLVTDAEEQHIAEILENLNPQLLDAPGLVTLFAKNDILRTLSDGAVPDNVTVVGQQPLELRKTESVLWIFNDARIFFSGRQPGAPRDMPPPLAGNYFASTAFAAQAKGAKRKAKTTNLVLTNYNVFFVSSPNDHRRLPISRITGLRAHVDGVEIGLRSRAWTLLVSDPWFLANALTFLSRKLGGRSGRSGSEAAPVNRAS